MTDPGPLPELPEIFRDVAWDGIVPEMRRPYHDRRRNAVCACNGSLLVAAPAACFRPEALAGLRGREGAMPDVERLIRRWRGDGRTHRLPGFDEDAGNSRRPVPVGSTWLMARWVAFLLGHRIRAVHAGRTPDDAVRFDADDAIEGLLLPMLPRFRKTPWTKGI